MPSISFCRRADNVQTSRKALPSPDVAFSPRVLRFYNQTNSKLSFLIIPIQKQERKRITLRGQGATLPLGYCLQRAFAVFPAPSFKTISCLFQNIQYFAFAIQHKTMTFTEFKAKKATGEDYLPPDDDSFSPDDLISRHSENFLSSYPLCSDLQQKVLERTPKKRRNVRLQSRMEPSEAKMRRISERRGGYKRSTNNSHKKFICVAKRLLLRLLEEPQRQEFEESYDGFKNSRTYYFIVLAHAKLLLSPQRLQSFRSQFRTLMENKVAYYQKEVDRTDNRNFINFRSDEIADIHFALAALELYLEDRVEAAIETIYKRDRAEVLKKQQFEQAVQVAREVEEKLRASNGHRQRQSVIILQHNAVQLKQEEKQQVKEKLTHRRPFAAVQQGQSLPFALGLHPGSSFSRADGALMEEAQETMPLLFLEKSFPYYSYFSEIIFPYEAQMQQLQSSPYLYSLCGQPERAAFNWKGADTYLPMMEEGVKGKLFVGKTGVEEQEEGVMRDQ